MNTQEILEKIEALYEILKAEHGRARKAAGELKKLANEYRKASTAEDKAK